MKTHRAYVTGTGRNSHSWTCSCGRQGGTYSSRTSAQTAASKHEKGK